MEIKDLVASIGVKHAEIEVALKANGADAAAGLKSAEKALDEIKTLANRITEAEQRLAERVKKSQESAATLGKSVAESASVKSFIAGESTRGRFETKAGFLSTQNADGSSDSSVVVPNRLSGIVGGALRALSLLDVIPVMGTTSNLVEFTKEAFYTDGSAPKADGAASGLSEIGFELASTPVREIATHIVMSKNVLGDSPQLMAYVNLRLTHALRMRLENQIASGDGVGQNLSGLTDAGNFTAFAPTAGEQVLDSVQRAITAVLDADYSADVVLMSPADWSSIARLKTTDGAYLVGDPVGGVIAQNVWGVPVIVTKAIPAGKFMVCNMAMAYSFFNRAGVTVELFTSHGTQATEGLVTMQASTRGAVAAFRPASSRYGNTVAA